MENRFGEVLKYVLADKGMQQKQLAEKIGVSSVTISRYVNGTRVPNAYMVMRIAEGLEVTTDKLLGK